MRLEKLLRAPAITLVGPTAISGEIIAEGRLGLAGPCRTCPDKPCLLDRSSGSHLCHKGVGYNVAEACEELICVFGVRIPSLHEGQKVSRVMKESLSGRTLSEKDFLDWRDSISDLMLEIGRSESEEAKDALDSLHDILKKAREARDCCEAAVVEAGGRSLKDGLEAASPNLRAAFQATRSLDNSIQLQQIYLNPDAAGFGRKRAQPIYRLVERLVHVLNAAGARRSGCGIDLTGASHGDARIHDSFEILPYALMENAVKYSPQQRVIVEFSESVSAITVSVTSTGPLILEEELPLIFTRGFRGKWGKRSENGSGLGLYAATVVADAHGTRIVAKSEDLNYSRGGIPQAENTFSFALSKS